MARLKVEVDEADLRLFRRFAAGELNAGLDRQRGIAHAAGAGDEGYDGGSLGLPRRARLGAAPPRDNVENLLRRSVLGNPVSVPRLHQLLVAAAGYLAADQDEENIAAIARDDVDKPCEGLCFGRWRDHEDKRLRA